MKKRNFHIFLVIVLPVLAVLSLFMVFNRVWAANHTVGGACGNTIQACINHASPGDSITIPAGTYNESITLDRPVSLIGENRETTVIQAITGQRVLTITGELIDNRVVISGVTFTGGDVSWSNTCYLDDPTNCGGGILILEGAQPILQDIIIRDNKAMRGGGIYTFYGSPLILRNSRILNNSSIWSGGGASINDGFEIMDSVIELNDAGLAGGGLVIQTSDQIRQVFTGTIRNTSIISNSASMNGGGLHVFSVNLFLVNNQFENNRSGERGGALYYLGANYYTSTLSILDSDFISNTAVKYGGGLFHINTTNWNNIPVDIIGGNFERNKAINGDGGGVYARLVEITGTQFLTNTAGVIGLSYFDIGGGGVRADEATITGATFVGNHSNKYGGGISIYVAGDTTEIRDTIFSKNAASINGGGVYVRYGGAKVYSSRFEDNRTLTPGGNPYYGEGNGGGLWVYQDLYMENTDFISNTAATGGGGVWVDQGNAIIKDSLFQNNQAENSMWIFVGGGGVGVNDGNLNVERGTFIGNGSQNTGGGIQVYGDLTMTHSLVQGNQSSQSGGGIRVDGLLTAADTQFVSNHAVDGYGGGALVSNGYPYDPITTTLTDTIFQDNSAVAGGGLYTNGALTASNTRFEHNTATETAGGGAYVFNAKPILTNVSFDSNHSEGWGGGLYALFVPFPEVGKLENTIFTNNTAINDGGGMYGFGWFDFNGNLFQDNHSLAGKGGGLYNAGRSFITDSSFLQNTAYLDGGNIYANSNVDIVRTSIEQGVSETGHGGGLYSWSDLKLAESSILANSAAQDGGGVYVYFRGYAADSLIKDNTAGVDGGGVYIGMGAYLTNTLFINNSSTGIGGGLVVSRTRSTSRPSHLVNLLFVRNTANGNGSGVYLNYNGPVDMIHNTLSHPTQHGGQAVYVNAGTVGITNTIITNHATGLQVAGGTVTSAYNLYYGNGVDEVGALNSSNHVVGDPVFVNPPADDYRLVVGSAALDNGSDAGIDFDLLANPRPLGSGYDRGAYEGGLKPTVNAGGPYQVDEGSTTTVLASGEGIEGDSLAFTWDLDNDGTFESIGQSVTFSAEFLDGPFPQEIAVKGTDHLGFSAIDTTIMNVNNVSPTIHTVTGPIEPVSVGEAVTVHSEFTDPGKQDTHTATVDWGDESSLVDGSVSEADGAGQITAGHTYSAPGIYSVRITLTDDDGDSHQATYQYIVVYDPNGSFVTGHGWFTSPPEAYYFDPFLSGKATFGFISKYKKGAEAPDGNSKFQFQTGNLNFQSTSYDWLVVSGDNTAKFKGSGTINGQGNYKFQIWAADNNPDKFRIKIWEEDESGTETVIYDNGFEGSGFENGQPIDGGNIVLHTKK